jgi:hypothetical protein
MHSTKLPYNAPGPWRVVIHHNSDWSGNALVSWWHCDREAGAAGGVEIDARQLVSGLASCPPEIPVDVFIRAVALAAATFVRTRCDLETVIDDAWSAALTGGQP